MRRPIVAQRLRLWLYASQMVTACFILPHELHLVVARAEIVVSIDTWNDNDTVLLKVLNCDHQLITCKILNIRLKRFTKNEE